MEFQRLARDIIQKRDNIFLESYKEGKDQGIDGGYFHQDSTIILQAKRRKGEFRSLYSHLKNVEREKVEELNPDRYILAIAMNLSPTEKEKIKELFHPYIKSSDDIICEEDFNNLLGQDKYKTIEQKYQQLWMPSTNILQNILNSAQHGVLLYESACEFNEAMSRAEVFVETQPYKKALKTLKEKKVVLISGEPGVGKTSIAYQLGVYFFQYKSYPAFFWVKSVDDIYVALKCEERKVIVFDDFWGSIFHESSISGSDEQRLAKIIERIKDDNKSVLILTTREYILRQGFQKHASLKEVVEKYKLECRLDEYRESEKVKIFFGHLKKSNLTWQQTEVMFDIHRAIVNHANYNPRIIEMFLRNVDIEKEPEECIEDFWNYIECPENFWQDIFTRLTTEARLLSVILLISPIPIQSNHLKEMYYRCLDQMGRVIEKQSFQVCIAELEKTVIKSLAVEEASAIIIKFQNPSAKEYLYNYLLQNVELYFDILLQGICCYNQLIYLLTHFSNDLSDEKYKKLFQKCVNNFESMPRIEADFTEMLDDNEFEYFEDELWNDNAFSQFYSLVCCYEKKKLVEYQAFIEGYIKKVGNQLENVVLKMDDEDIDIYPLVVKKCINFGIYFNGLNVIKASFNRSCYENQALRIDDFKEIFPQEYQEFLNSYKEQIIDYLEEYYTWTLECFLEWGDVDRCKYECSQIPKQLEVYGLEFTAGFKTIIEECLNGLDEAAVVAEGAEWGDSQEEQHLEESELRYDEIVGIFHKYIFGEKHYFWEEDLQDFIRESVLSDSLKNELLELNEQKEYWYINEFLKDEDSFLFLERYLLDEGLLHKGVMLFTFQLIEKMSSFSEISKQQLIGFLINMCIDIMYRENAMLTKEEIISTEAYRLYFEDNEQYFWKLVKCGVLIERGKWYELVNIFLIMAPYALFVTNLEQEEKVNYYDSMDMIEEKWPIVRVRKKKSGVVEDSTYTADLEFYYFENMEWERVFHRTLFELDQVDYLELYMRPMAHEYFQKVKRDIIPDTVSMILKSLEIIIDIDRYGEQVGSQVAVPVVWRVIESLDIGDTFDLVPYEFTEEQMRYIAKKFDLIQERDREIYRIDFRRLENREITEIISVLEIDKSAEIVLKNINEVLRIY